MSMVIKSGILIKLEVALLTKSLYFTLGRAPSSQELAGFNSSACKNNIQQ